MKTTFAILFSALLAMGQCAFMPAAIASSAPASCACPGCEKACCAARQHPASQPAAPARTVSQNQSVLQLAILARLVILAQTPVARFSASFPSSPLAASAVPVYQRNCSYLI